MGGFQCNIKLCVEFNDQDLGVDVRFFVTRRGTDALFSERLDCAQDYLYLGERESLKIPIAGCWTTTPVHRGQ
jgi:hypothetical protein